VRDLFLLGCFFLRGFKKVQPKVQLSILTIGLFFLSWVEFSSTVGFLSAFLFIPLSPLLILHGFSFFSSPPVYATLGPPPGIVFSFFSVERWKKKFPVCVGASPTLVLYPAERSIPMFSNNGARHLFSLPTQLLIYLLPGN